MCNVQGCRKAPHQHHCLGDGMGASAGPESWQHEQVVSDRLSQEPPNRQVPHSCQTGKRSLPS